MKYCEDFYKRRSKGMTFVEVMMAVMIFSITAIPLINLFLSSSEASLRQRYFGIANKLLIEKMEEFRHTNFNKLTCTDPDDVSTVKITTANPTIEVSGDFKGQGLGGYQYPKEYERFRWEATFTGIAWDAISGQLDMMKVKVTVFWHDKRGEKERKVEMVSVIKRPGALSKQ
jgi:prepilin-type N-terminal cleavage/methylation domain-containing protein